MSPFFLWVKNNKSLSIDVIFGHKIEPCKNDPLMFINPFWVLNTLFGPITTVQRAKCDLLIL
jgi:uncharacterized GH25 family protein